MLKAFEYIENIGGYEKMEEIEKQLVEYSLEKFNTISELRLIGSTKPQNRV